MPLTSVTQYLLTSTSEQREVYFKEIGHNRPYDLSYIRFMLLGKKYQYFYDFIVDLNQCFTHYDNVRERYGLPDIIAEAKA